MNRDLLEEALQRLIDIVGVGEPMGHEALAQLEKKVQDLVWKDQMRTPTFKEFEPEYVRSLGSEELCEHSCSNNKYMVLYSYKSWLEDQLSKRVDMTMRKGYRR